MLPNSRRRFLHSLASVAGASLFSPMAWAKPRPVGALKHRPQVYTAFPHRRTWESVGVFERFPLWPHSGNLKSFNGEPEWTAFYRYQGHPFRPNESEPSNALGFFQVFVCKGSLLITSSQGKTVQREYGTGDFFCEWFLDSEWNSFSAEEGTTLLVKRQQFLPSDHFSALQLTKNEYDFFSLPFLIPSRDESGLLFNVNSSFLAGGVLSKINRNMTSVTMLEHFEDGTVAPSHYHANPVWHEFVYLQGGHLTPDGFFGPGDHIASIPGCKEGPYLSCMSNQRSYPKEWPIYIEPSLLRRPVEEPWPKIFQNERDGIYGVLFVHYGPFAKITPLSLANWTILDPYELGPKG
ncbi:MAG: hypothetical protein AB1540_12690 [Bdellovibrionota bacterium]